LLVEDDVDLAHQLSHHLRGLGGYRVHVSRYGHAALHHVRAPDNRVDLIVVDLHLPDIDGSELVRQLLQEPRAAHVPLVAIATTGESSSEEREQILELGATRFVNRPLQVPELIAEMERALAESKASVVGASE
jgi:CheY-like chemotaxis protein